MMYSKFSGSQRYWFFGFHQNGFGCFSKDDRMVFGIGFGFFRIWIWFSFGFGFAFGLVLLISDRIFVGFFRIWFLAFSKGQVLGVIFFVFKERIQTLFRFLVDLVSGFRLLV